MRASVVKQRCRTSVARMSGAICGYGREASMSIPDVALLIRATKEKREAERRQTQCHNLPARKRRAGRATEGAACAALPLSGALACRRSTTALAEGTYVTQGATQAMLPGTRSERALPAFACPSPVSTSRAGRSIGRHDARAARRAELMRPRPRAPHSPLPPGITRTASLRARLIRIICNENGDIVNEPADDNVY